MIHKLLNVDNLTQNRLVRLSDDRRFLVSPKPKKAGVVEWKVLPYKKAHFVGPLITTTYTLGAITLEVSGSCARFKQGSNDLWVIDTDRFAGNPKLKVTQESAIIRMNLSNARFPGTPVPADFSAEITPDGASYRLKLLFDWGGFEAEVGLEAWLTGVEEALSTLLLVDEVCPLSKSEGMHLNGSPAARFYPSWLFLVLGDGVASFRANGADITVDALALALLAPGMPSILVNPPLRRSLVAIASSQPADSFAFPLWPGVKDWWSFSSDAPIFKAIWVEAGEQLSGPNPIRRALLVTSSPSAVLKFLPGADPVGDDGGPFGVELAAPLYAAFYDGAGIRHAAGLLALLPKKERWLHSSSSSLLLGPALRAWFLLAEIDDAFYLGHPGLMLQNIFGLGFGLLATVARPGGVVVDPLPAFPGSLMALTLAPPSTPLPPNIGEARFEAGKPSALVIFPAQFLTIFVRPRDLLVLGFRFMNLRLFTSGQETPYLIPEQGASPVIVVYFSAQSIGEQAFVEHEDGSGAPGNPPIEARLAGLSRLAFNVVTNRMPFTLETLLGWDGSSPYLTPKISTTAQTPPVLPAPDAEYPEPALDETAIEAPFRLFVSPDQDGVWKSLSGPFEKESRAELWHSRLGKKNGDTPEMRAIWTTGGTKSPPTNPFLMSLDPQDRANLVLESVPVPFKAKRFMLTALGAWLDVEGKWDDPSFFIELWQHRATLGRDHYVRVVERGYLMPFGHRAVYVKITERKFYEKTGGLKGAWLRKRQFIIVREAERSYTHPSEADAFSSPDFRRKLPFKKVRIATTVTPLLELPVLMDEVALKLTVPGEYAFWPMVKGAGGAVGRCFFHLVGTDMDDVDVEFSAPLAFVRAAGTGITDDDYAKLVDAAISDAGSGDPAKRVYPFNGAQIAFVPSLAGADAESAVEAANMTYSAVRDNYPDDPDPMRPFNPVVTEAQVSLQVLRKLGGLDNAVRVNYSDHYLTNGFNAGNKGQVYLRLLDGADLAFGAANRPDKVGGVLSPSMKVCGLSRAIGAVGGSPSGTGVTPVTDDDLADISTGTFNPLSYFGQGAPKLLGSISLVDILDSVPFLDDLNDLVNSPKAPRWISTREADKTVYRLVWETTNLKSGDVFKNSIENGSQTLQAKLKLQVESAVKAAGGADSSLLGSLTNFAIELGGVIKIEFKELTFSIPAGGKPDVTVKIADPGLTFDGDLKFLRKIQQYLGLENFGDPPSLDVTADGITAGYSIRIPTIAVGAFALQNLALSAGMNLPFTGQPLRANFAISERQSPFLVTVSLFTGGGFFGFMVGPDGVQMLEASIEFGGSFSLNLGVASGGVYVMAGVYIKLENSAAHLTGYLRAGGSLDVLGLITVSVEFYLGFTYEPDVVWGEASMTVEIDILFFSTSVTLTVRREFASGSRDIPFDEMMSKNDWNDYIAAFAAEEV